METDVAFFLVFGTILMVVIAFSVYLFMMAIRRRAIKHTLEMEQAENELLQAKVREREQTLEFVSWELHDNVCQVLGMSGTLLLDVAKMPEGARKSGLIEQTGERLITVVKDLKNLSATLNGNKIQEIGIVRFIEKEVSFIGSLHQRKMECSFKHDQDLPKFASNTLILLSRIVQEAIMNIIKHSEATKVCITLGRQKGSIILSIADNGRGFNPVEKRNEKMGILNMRERAQFLNAQLDITSAPGKGSRIDLTLITNEEWKMS